MTKRKKISKKEFDEMSVEERGKLLIRDFLMKMLKIVLRGKLSISLWDRIGCPKCLTPHAIEFGLFEQGWIPCKECGYEFPDDITPPNKFELVVVIKRIQSLKKFLSDEEIYKVLILEDK